MANETAKIRVIDKKALQNVITHVEISNRAKEERDMWRNYKNNESGKSYRETKKRKADVLKDYKISKKSKKKKKHHKEIEDDDSFVSMTTNLFNTTKSQAKWGHDGFQELYEKQNIVLSDSSNASIEKKSKKSKRKKTHKKKKKSKNKE